MTSFLGIYREPLCSPGRHRDNDAAILELVAGELEASGFPVMLTTAHEAPRFGADASLVFSMSRSPMALELLRGWTREGRTVVNQADAVLATTRRQLVGRALGKVTLPAAYVLPTARAVRGDVAALWPRAEWWVKGGDLYASRREDVQRVETMEALECVLDDFARRGIATAVLQEHVRGREIKFYAVAAGFFHWLDTCRPSANGTGDEGFQRAAVSAGTALSLEIFGGDIVIGDDGRVTLIDLNDWPSFAPCREGAARAIAQYLEYRLAASALLIAKG